MTGKYVPPALRNKTNTDRQTPATPETREPPDPNLHSLEDIKCHFWPDHGSTDQDLKPHTLNASSQDPKSLAFVVLFHGANPRWEAEKTIFARSNLELLPEPKANEDVKTDANDTSSRNRDDESTTFADDTAADVEDAGDGKAVPGPPIPVFRQINAKQRSGPVFQFEGWFQISRLAYVEPDSPELVRMLEQKWVGGGRRDAGSWSESLALRWAVIRFSEDEKASKDRGELLIERQNVNEMLAKLRAHD